jgi:PAS domain S-box-containing protein
MEENELRLLIDSSTDLMWSLTTDFKLIAANAAFLKSMARYDAWVPQPGDSLLSEIHFPKDYVNYWRTLYTRALSGETLSIEVPDPETTDGRIGMFEITLQPLYEEKKIRGALCFGKDITKRFLAEKELIESEKFLNETQEIAKLGTYIIDLASGNWTASKQLNTILGIDSEYTKNYAGGQAIIHPDWRKKVEDYFVEEVLEKKSKFDFQYKIVRINDKQERWVQCIGNLKYNDKNEAVTLVATVTDITDHLKSKEEVEKLNKKYRDLLANLDAGVVMHAPDTSVLSCNLKGLELLGLTDDQIKGKLAMDPQWKFIDAQSNDLPLEMYPVNQIINSKKAIHNIIAGVNRPVTKDVVWLIVNGFPEFDEKGELTEIVISFIDITEHRRMEMDISERIRFEKELTQQKEKAEEGDKLKTAFLQNISHEIRTPMNAIVGFSKMLDDSKISDEERKKYTSIIINNTHQLLSIVTDILTISAIDTRQEKVNTNQVELNQLLTDLIAQFKNQAKNSDVELSLSLPQAASTTKIFTDKTKLIQILSNLLSNSLKFTSKGSIEFGYLLKGNEIEFYIKDTGIGIDLKQQKKIFERFRQADFSISNKYGGSGLGLSISKGFVELLGGKIWLESSPGVGTTFYFTLPYIPVLEMDDIAIPVKQLNTASTILIAEDEGLNYLYLKLVFERLNFKIVHAKNGQEAVDMCKANTAINAVFMDIKMPVMDGYSAAKQIKKIRPDLPIIAQTGYALSNEKEKYSENAFDDYVSKPIDEELLIQKFSKFIQMN